MISQLKKLLAFVIRWCRIVIYRLRLAEHRTTSLQKLNQIQPQNRKRLFIAIVVASTIVFIQLIYPSNRLLPNTKILGSNYGFKTKDQAAGKIDNTDKQISLTVGDKTVDTKLSSMGLAIDGKLTVNPALGYSFASRLVPLSIFKSKRVNDFGIKNYDNEVAKAYLATLAKFDKQPTNATLALDGAKIIVTPSVNGYTYSTEKGISDILTQRLKQDNKLNVPRQIVQPNISTVSAQATAIKLDSSLKAGFVVNIEGNQSRVTPEQVASWITFSADQSSKEVLVNYDRQKIQTTLDPFAAKVYKTQTPNKVTAVDGVPTGKIPGIPGKELNIQKSIDAVIEAINQSKTTATAVISAIQPKTETAGTYTRSSKGIQALIDSWVASHGGTYYIAMKEVSGQIGASYNSSTKVTPASLYKLYVADVVYTKVANGQLDLSSTVLPGYSIASCLEVMIVRSDNPCAIALGELIGWQNNDGFLSGQGFGSTTLRRASLATSASNTLNYLLKLHNGSLINSNYSSSLLSAMRRQIYRSGIPAGSAGAVADKVGFIDGLNHDAAIVYHPKGTYVLVIMSKGSSFSNIADLSRQISNVMGQ